MDPLPTKTRILDAAAKVFLEHGFVGTSMDQVRREAGVSNGSLYHHFATKAQLADALYAQTLREFHGAMLAPLTDTASAEIAVKGMVGRYAEWVTQHPGSARLLHELKRAGGLAGGAGEWQLTNAETFAQLRAWIARKVEAGEMRALPFPVWMAVVVAPAMALTPHWVTQQQVSAKVRAALEHAAWMAVAP